MIIWYDKQTKLIFCRNRMLYDELFSFFVNDIMYNDLTKCTNLCEWHDNFMCNKNVFFYKNSRIILGMLRIPFILLQSSMQIIDIEISFLF